MICSTAHLRAIDAIGELLTAQRLEFMFVGGVARVAWLGGTVDSGSIDVLATLQPTQKSQIAMMASNRGFTVEREQIDASEELDLIPLQFEDVRVHILVASNALYARMVRDAWSERIGGHDWRVPSREDLALLLAVAGDDASVDQLLSLPEFDRSAYNDKLVSIGLGSLVRS